MRQAKLVGLALIALLFLIVAAQNTGPAEVRLLFASFSVPVAVLLFVAVAVGFLVGLGLAFYLTARSKKPKAAPADPPPP